MPFIPHPSTIQHHGSGLDHPECLCIGADGALYAGGEAGQIYRIPRDGSAQAQVASTGGFILGMACDGDGLLHVCDAGRKEVLLIDPATGSIRVRAGGFTVPNFPVFDAAGNLYVSDSGDYWHEQGSGLIRVLRRDGGDEVFHRGPFRFANGLAISEQFLYIAQSTAHNVVRVPLATAHAAVEPVCMLPAGRVPDGLYLCADGTLLISCYTPDEIWRLAPGARVAELLAIDPTHELLISPTNILVDAGRIYTANIGGWFLTSFATALPAGTTHRPRLRLPS